MKAIVIGSGAREHAVAKGFAASTECDGVLCLPGNVGTESIGRNIGVDLADHAAVVSACRANGVDLAFIGPEDPLADGLADSLRAAGIPTFGPGKSAARLESSKSFARERSDAWGVPSAKTLRFSKGDHLSFETYLRTAPGKVVLKKSGLAAGKGVVESADPAVLAAFGRETLDGDDLLSEEFLEGWEMSVFALCDENSHLTLPPCSDHKKARENDSGPNTGGMGAICPVPKADQALMERVEREIIAPTFEGMKRDGLSYRGVLFFGIMVTPSGPRLLEYNVRFGDPETQSLLALWNGNFLQTCHLVAEGRTAEARPDFLPGFACGVVVAAPGYPGEYPKRVPVHSLPQDGNGISILHATTSRTPDGRIGTGGGRCFTVVARASTLAAAQRLALASAEKVRFEGAWYRKDIGARFI